MHTLGKKKLNAARRKYPELEIISGWRNHELFLETKTHTYYEKEGELIIWNPGKLERNLTWKEETGEDFVL
ncbi:MAG: hypothetical protein DRP59_06105 [Spirochaetes bacterium]|nr:MAG: hypothetical protein DRP59_06105 [Spirochaetota bacterium]